MITDTHAHLYYPELISQIGDILARAEDAGIRRIIVPAVDAETSKAVIELSTKYDQIYCAIGIHPCDVSKTDYSAFEEIAELAANKKVVGIGETGLDYYWDKSGMERQKEFFRLHIELAKQVELPIIIHTRDSTQDAISMISEKIDDKLSGHFHCFSGNKEELKRILDFRNFYVSYCGNVTYKNFKTAEVVEQTPAERMLSETDSPFLPPVPYRGKTNKPAFVIHTLKKISEIKQMDYDDLTSAIGKNTEILFFGKR